MEQELQEGFSTAEQGKHQQNTHKQSLLISRSKNIDWSFIWSVRFCMKIKGSAVEQGTRLHRQKEPQATASVSKTSWAEAATGGHMLRGTESPGGCCATTPTKTNEVFDLQQKDCGGFRAKVENAALRVEILKFRCTLFPGRLNSKHFL